MWIFLNGEFVNPYRATISVFDRGFLYGDGLFETLRSYQGNLFRIKQHLERLKRGAEVLGIPLPEQIAELPEIIQELIQINSLTKVDSAIRITLSRGPGPRGLNPVTATHPTLLVTVEKLDPKIQYWQDKGIFITVLSQPKEGFFPLAQVKSLNALSLILGYREAQERGAEEGIFVSPQGYLLEGTRTNIFLLHQTVLSTPPLSLPIFPGITRSIVIELAQGLGYSVKERLLKVQDLIESQEIFLTNSLMEIVPATRFDSYDINLRRVGLLTRRLQKAYNSLVRSNG
jgi:branched-chain amino acid aminotransferase